MVIKNGYPFYGQKIGVIVLEGKSSRIPGDPGHAKTFDYSICYEVVKGSFSDLIDGSDEIKKKLIEATTNLENRGVEGVIGDCGLMSLYQKEMKNSVNIPVLSSSLSLVPFIQTIIGKEGSIGIITGHSGLISQKHLIGAGIDKSSDIIIQGMEEEEHFKEIVINGNVELNEYRMREDVLNAVGKLLKREENLKAILLECSNLATYSYFIYEKYKLPVFDIVVGANMIYYSVNPINYFEKIR